MVFQLQNACRVENSNDYFSLILQKQILLIWDKPDCTKIATSIHCFQHNINWLTQHNINIIQTRSAKSDNYDLSEIVTITCNLKYCGTTNFTNLTTMTDGEMNIRQFSLTVTISTSFLLPSFPHISLTYNTSSASLPHPEKYTANILT